jgi:hypothetical protein
MRREKGSEQDPMQASAVSAHVAHAAEQVGGCVACLLIL